MNGYEKEKPQHQTPYAKLMYEASRIYCCNRGRASQKIKNEKINREKQQLCTNEFQTHV